MTENHDENEDICLKCGEVILLNHFTKKWEGEHYDFPAMCPSEDGAIKEKLHTPKKTYVPPPKVVPNISAQGAWGWVPPPPTMENTEPSTPVTPTRAVRGCGSYSAYYNQRPELEPDISAEILEMPII